MEKVILKSMTDFVLEQRMSTEKVNESSFYQIQSHIYSYYDKIFAYAEFLRQPLNLRMFVPAKLVDGVWVVLEEPKYDKLDRYCKKEKCDCDNDTEVENYTCRFKEYQEAKDRVIFEGFCIMEDKHYSTKREIIWMPDNITQVWRRLTFHSGKIEVHFFDCYDEFKTIENLVKYNLELTPTAQKQIGL